MPLRFWMLFPLMVTGVGGAASLPRLEPSVARLKPGEAVQFRVTLDGKAVPVEAWSVNGVQGGNAALGLIDARGRYRAPAKPITPSELHVGAKVRASAPRTLMATALVAAPDPPYRLAGTWGEAGDEAGRFRGPHSVAVAPNGDLVVVDSVSSRVARFAPDGQFRGEIGKGKGEGPGEFKNPRDARIDPAGRVYVSDGDNQRIQVFDALGKFLFSFGKKGKGPGDLLRAHALDFGPDGRVFAVDVDNSRVSIYAPDGRFLSDWGREGRGPGEFHAPHSIGVDLNGDVIVSNYWAPCQKFTAEGRFLFDFAHAQPPDGPVRFHSMSLDRWGNAYLAARDRQGTLVAKYNNQGDLVTTWRLAAPDHSVEWVAVDPRGTAYVAFRGKKSLGVEVYERR